MKVLELLLDHQVFSNLNLSYLLIYKVELVQGFHTCVGSGGDRQDPEWYQKHGIEVHVNGFTLFI